MKNLFNRNKTNTTVATKTTNENSLLENILIGFGTAAVVMAAASAEYAEQQRLDELETLRNSRGDKITHQIVVYKLRDKNVDMKNDVKYIMSVIDVLNRIYDVNKKEQEFLESSIIFTGYSKSYSFKELMDMGIINISHYGRLSIDETIRRNAIIAW